MILPSIRLKFRNILYLYLNKYGSFLEISPLKSNHSLIQIWSPRLAFGNLRDQGQLLIQRVVISRGHCEIWQRWLITMGFVVDAKNFPFDVQRLVIRQQSIQFNSSIVTFKLIQNTANFTKFDHHLRLLRDPTFEFSNLTQHTDLVNDGASVGIMRLFTSITAARYEKF